MDHKLEQFFSDYYNVNYDIKLLATTAATKEEKEGKHYKVTHFTTALLSSLVAK